MAKDVDEVAAGGRGREGPAWVEHFLSHGYFGICNKHTGGKGERNHFCLDCAEGPLCSVGLRTHAGHATLQTRKASYKDAVRVADVQRYLDVRDIMIYSINGSKIVFLHRRPQANPPKTHPRCEMCKRTFAEQLRFCSLQCKLDAIRSKPFEPELTFSIAEEGGSALPSVAGGAGAAAAAAAQPVMKKKVIPGDTCSEAFRKDGSVGSAIRQGTRVQARKQADAKKAGGSGGERDPELDGQLQLSLESPVVRKRRMREKADDKEEDNNSVSKHERDQCDSPEAQPGGLVRKRRKSLKPPPAKTDTNNNYCANATESASSSLQKLGNDDQVGSKDKSSPLLRAFDILANRKTLAGRLTIVCSPTSVLPLQAWQGALGGIASPVTPQAGVSSTPVSPQSGSPIRSPAGSSYTSPNGSPGGSPNVSPVHGAPTGMDRSWTERRHSRKGIPHRAPFM